MFRKIGVFILALILGSPLVFANDIGGNNKPDIIKVPPEGIPLEELGLQSSNGNGRPPAADPHGFEKDRRKLEELIKQLAEKEIKVRAEIAKLEQLKRINGARKVAERMKRMRGVRFIKKIDRAI